MACGLTSATRFLVLIGGASRALNFARRSSTAAPAARQLRPATATPASMGQRSIESFFSKPAAGGNGSKRSTSTAAAAGSDGGDNAKRQRLEEEPEQQQQQQQQVAQPAAADPVVAAAADAAGASAAPADPEEEAGDAAGAAGLAAAGGTPTAALQLTEQQLFRMLANKNQAQAKQVVIAAERAGTLPALGDLLVEPSWRELLGPELQKPYFKELEKFVQGEWGKSMVFPPKDCIFQALNTVPVDHVKVVVLGQDPYHDNGQATGLSFSVPKGKAIPSSLRNMYKELQADCGCPPGKHGDLTKWAQQGVLLLNAVLTVRAHTPASHAKKGWETFTDAVIAALSARRKDVVFLLWGRYAQDKGKRIDKARHSVLAAAHPSGLSANRGFFGCRHFSKANELLEKAGQVPIDWCIDT